MDTSNLKIRHTKSQQEYPFLNLQDDEYVELEFGRAAICTVLIWVFAIFASVLLIVFLAIFNSNTGPSLLPTIDATPFINLVGIVFLAIILLAALISTRVFHGNRLFVTNKRAIQYVMISLFGTSVNFIDLERIEDVSFHQSGAVEHLFGIGTIRMSTVGDETTYTFKLAYKPTPREMSTLTHLISTSNDK